ARNANNSHSRWRQRPRAGCRAAGHGDRAGESAAVRLRLGCHPQFNHFGIAAYHALKAVAEDMIGYSMTNASPLVAPTYSSERMLGTNPMCYAFPAGAHPPVVVDLATSAAANGKLEIAEIGRAHV